MTDKPTIVCQTLQDSFTKQIKGHLQASLHLNVAKSPILHQLTFHYMYHTHLLHVSVSNHSNVVNLLLTVLHRHLLGQLQNLFEKFVIELWITQLHMILVDLRYLGRIVKAPWRCSGRSQRHQPANRFQTNHKDDNARGREV